MVELHFPTSQASVCRGRPEWLLVMDCAGQLDLDGGSVLGLAARLAEGIHGGSAP